MCTGKQVCLLHAFGWIAHNMGTDIHGVEHTKLGTIPKIEQSISIGPSKGKVEVYLSEVAEGRWSIRCHASLPEIRLGEGRLATVMAAELADLRDDMCRLEVFVARHAHATKGWWSTQEIKDALAELTRQHAQFIDALKSAVEQAQMGQMPAAVGEA